LPWVNIEVLVGQNPGCSGRYRDHCQWDFFIGLSCFE
jgi:hypothetical protein